MTPSLQELILTGNQLRSEHRPEEALRYYAAAMINYPNSVDAFNNYGNVIRECGYPERGIPFLQNVLAIDPNHETAAFNLAICYLLKGDYAKGWDQYETRWNYEHLKDLLPKFQQPRWQGESLNEKTILVLGEQGHGDTIQFIRFVDDLIAQGAQVIVAVDSSLVELFKESTRATIISVHDNLPVFDTWTPIMSIPGFLGVTLENLQHKMQYLTTTRSVEWFYRLGDKSRLRIGVAWSGRRDSWIHNHKSMPFETILDLIKRTPEYEWYNLQMDCTEDEANQLRGAGVHVYTDEIQSFADTAGLVMHLDVVISVDTAVAHLAGALGRPTWIPLNQYGTDWRWLLNRDDSPWYPSARLFRQPVMGDWNSVTTKIEKFLSWFKI